MRRLFYVELFIALLAADQLTKLLLPTPEWGWDDKALPVQTAVTGLCACAVFLAYPPMRLAGTAFLAALLGNFTSALAGDVANPFVIGNVAWNLADLLLMVGYVLIPLSSLAVYRDMRRRWVRA